MDRGMLSRFPRDVEDFANMFVTMQAKRHAADYEPDGRYYKSAVAQDVSDTEDVINRFAIVPVKDRRAFAAWVLLRTRR